MGILDRIRNALATSNNSESVEFEDVIEKTLQEFIDKELLMYECKPGNSDVFKNEVSNWSDKKRVSFIVYLTKAYVETHRKYQKDYDTNLAKLFYLQDEYVTYLCRIKMEVDDEDFQRLLDAFIDNKKYVSGNVMSWPIGMIVNKIYIQVGKNGLNDAMKKSLLSLKDYLEQISGNVDQKAKAKIDEKVKLTKR